MGACCSGAAITPKDPEDLTLDELDIKVTRLNRFDDVFGSSADPINTAVDLNNAILNSLDKIKEAAAAIFGAHVIKVTINSNQVTLGIFAVEDDGTEVELSAERLNAIFSGPNGPNFQAAWNQANAARDSLNSALTAAPPVAVHVKKTRVFHKIGQQTEDQEDVVERAKGQVQGFNNAVFKVRLELMRACAEQALNPKNAVLEILQNIKKHIGSLVPRVHADFSQIQDGRVDFDFRMPDFNVNLLPHKIKVAYLAIMSENEDNMGLIPTIKGTISQLSGLIDQFNAIPDAIKSLPTDAGEIQNMCTEASLPVLFIPKVPGRIAHNTQQFGNAPAVLKGLLDTIQMVVKQLQDAIAELPQ